LVPSNVFCRVILVRHNGHTGTMFALDCEGRQYFVTAKHLVDDVQGQIGIEVRHNDNWKILDLALVGHSPDSDVSVFAAGFKFVHEALIAEPTTANLYFGQDAFFLGFPFGWHGKAPEMTNGYPLPFIKRATVSMFDLANQNCLFLDGLNNPGFSGGPVAYKVIGTENYCIAGVVSGYHSTREFLTVGDDETDYEYWANSGLIYVVPIQSVIAVIESNPVGFQLGEQPLPI
jgi:S1-C subfamily serine protease